MIKIYGRPGCGYCVAAVKICEQYELPHTYKTIEGEDELKDIAERAGVEVKTVPQIFWYDRYVGGYTELLTEIEDTRSYGQERI